MIDTPHIHFGDVSTVISYDRIKKYTKNTQKIHTKIQKNTQKIHKKIINIARTDQS